MEKMLTIWRKYSTIQQSFSNTKYVQEFKNVCNLKKIENRNNVRDFKKCSQIIKKMFTISKKCCE